MKKTALTFGLFSLVIVATSFANPTVSSTSNEKVSILSPIDGGQKSGDFRKQDFHPIDGGQKSGDFRKQDFHSIDGGQKSGDFRKQD
jgi:hypothetical protein